MHCSYFFLASRRNCRVVGLPASLTRACNSSASFDQYSGAIGTTMLPPQNLMSCLVVRDLVLLAIRELRKRNCEIFTRHPEYKSDYGCNPVDQGVHRIWNDIPVLDAISCGHFSSLDCDNGKGRPRLLHLNTRRIKICAATMASADKFHSSAGYMCLYNCSTCSRRWPQ